MDASAIIKRFDKIENSQASFGSGFEGAAINEFLFKGAPEGFHGGVVVTVSLAAHRGENTLLSQGMAKLRAGVLAAAIGIGTLSLPSAALASGGGGISGFPEAVRPIFQARCISCHSEEKHKGALQMDTLEALLKGGENGPVILPGNATESPLLRRLLLPLDNEDHMPPAGKPQPTPGELAALRQWMETLAAPK